MRNIPGRGSEVGGKRISYVGGLYIYRKPCLTHGVVGTPIGSNKLAVAVFASFNSDRTDKKGNCQDPEEPRRTPTVTSVLGESLVMDHGFSGMMAMRTQLGPVSCLLSPCSSHPPPRPRL